MTIASPMGVSAASCPRLVADDIDYCCARLSDALATRCRVALCS